MSAPARRLDPIGFLWAVAAAGLGGTVGTAEKWVLGSSTGPLPVVALRATIAAGIIGLALLFRPRMLRLSWRDLPFFALYGLVGVAILFFSYIAAVFELGAALSTTLFYTFPTMATLLAAAFLKERLTLRKAVPLPVTFLGCALVAGLFSARGLALRPAGVAWALFSALGFAFYPIFGRHALARYSHWTTLFYSLAFGALWLDLSWAVLCPLLPVTASLCGTGPLPHSSNLAFWGGMLYLALFATVGLYLSDLQAIRRLEVRQVGLIGTSEPLIAALLAGLLFHERLTPLQWLGAVLILSGVVWLRLERQPSASSDPHSADR